MSGGWNPTHGYDEGPRPALGPVGAPLRTPGRPYVNHAGPHGRCGGTPVYAPGNAFTYAGYPYQGLAHPQVPYVPQMMPQSGVFTSPMGIPRLGPQAHVATGFPGYRAAQVMPRIDPDFPAAEMTNSTGGMGCEPGYNYFFPAEHTKVHVYRSAEPPWQCPANTEFDFHATHVPCTTTLKEILKGFGATNAVAKKNKCFEITQAGNGKWYKGLSFSGDQDSMMSKTIKHLGWDKTRTGMPDGKPAVCIWFSRD